jgi:hypothetical protein
MHENEGIVYDLLILKLIFFKFKLHNWLMVCHACNWLMVFLVIDMYDFDGHA